VELGGEGLGGQTQKGDGTQYLFLVFAQHCFHSRSVLNCEQNKMDLVSSGQRERVEGIAYVEEKTYLIISPQQQQRLDVLLTVKKTIAEQLFFMKMQHYGYIHFFQQKKKQTFTCMVF